MKSTTAGSSTGRVGVRAHDEAGHAARRGGGAGAGDRLAMLGARLADEAAHVDQARRDDVARAIDDAGLGGNLFARDRGADPGDQPVDDDQPAPRLGLALGIDEPGVEESDGLGRRHGERLESGAGDCKPRRRGSGAALGSSLQEARRRRGLVFLGAPSIRPDSAGRSGNSGVGTPWIPLDSFVRNEPFQWVTALGRRIFFCACLIPYRPCLRRTDGQPQPRQAPAALAVLAGSRALFPLRRCHAASRPRDHGSARLARKCRLFRIPLPPRPAKAVERRASLDAFMPREGRPGAGRTPLAPRDFTLAPTHENR